MARKNPAAVTLGRKGGRANTTAQRLARSRNTGRPKLYRLADSALEKHVGGRWLVLEPPYDAAAKAFLSRNR